MSYNRSDRSPTNVGSDRNGPLPLLSQGGSAGPSLDSPELTPEDPTRAVELEPPGLAFRVAGTPRPQPRPRFVRAGSRIRAVSTVAPQVQLWRTLVLRAVRQAVASSEPLRGALEVELVFTFAPPRTAEGRSRIGQPHTQRPDADNLAKLVLDVMQAGRAFADDAKVARLTVVKAWGEDQGAAVTVRQLRR